MAVELLRAFVRLSSEEQQRNLLEGAKLLEQQRALDRSRSASDG